MKECQKRFYSINQKGSDGGEDLKKCDFLCNATI
jgi:hypothetical protein